MVLPLPAEELLPLWVLTFGSLTAEDLEREVGQVGCRAELCTATCPARPRRWRHQPAGAGAGELQQARVCPPDGSDREARNPLPPPALTPPPLPAGAAAACRRRGCGQSWGQGA
jgi:hypothetical protein